MITFEKAAEVVAVGDLVEFLGHTHRIVAITDHEHPDLGSYRHGEAADDWCIALWPGEPVWIVDESAREIAA